MSADHWYSETNRQADSPSRRHGIPEEKEQAYLQQTANFLQEMGRRLSLPLLCINTAVLYTQRFYIYHSLSVFEKYALAASALYLAAKVEEHPRKAEHVCQMAKILGLVRKDVKDFEYIQDLLLNENILLQTLGFEVQVIHPHQHVLRITGYFHASKTLSQTSYMLATYCLHLTKLCLVYKPAIIACLCIHMACKMTGWAIPISKEGKEWFLYGDASITEEILERICDEFLDVLSKCPDKFKNKTLLANHENLVKRLVVDPTGLPVVKDSTLTPIKSTETPEVKEGSESSSQKLVRSLHEAIRNFASTLNKRPSSKALNETMEWNIDDSFLDSNKIRPGAQPESAHQKILKISTESRHQPSEKGLQLLKPTSSRSLLDPNKVITHPKSAQHISRTDTSEPSVDYNKNKWVRDINQKKLSSHGSSPSLEKTALSDVTNPAPNATLRVLSQPLEPFQSKNSVLLSSTPTEKSAVPPEQIKPKERQITTHAAVSSGSLKISIPRSRIMGIQPLRPGIPVDVSADQSKIYRIPLLGPKTGLNAPKRFKPN